VKSTLTTLVIVALAAAAWFFADLRERPDDSRATHAPPPVTVGVTEVHKETWESFLSATGTLRAAQGVVITPQEEGLVTAIHFRSGQQVNKGDLLLEQYTEEEQQQLQSVLAQLDLAQKNYDRSQDLVGKQAVSQSELDTKLSELERLSALAKNLEVAIAKRKTHAPFAGQLGVRKVNPGQYLEAGDPVVRLESLGKILVDFSLPQNQLGQVGVGQPVRVRVDAWPGEIFAGAVTAIEPLVDAGTRNFNVEAALVNNELKLLPGMFVNTELVVDSGTAVLAIPQAAVMFSPYGNSVYVVENSGGEMTANSRSISLGTRHGDKVAVTAGLEPGERVVFAGHLRLRNGGRVAIDEKLAPFDSAGQPMENH